MGYEINIKREQENPITLQEWKNYIISATDFYLTDEFSTSNSTGVWKTSKDIVHFTFQENSGVITVKNPDDWVISKMIDISNSLNAIVVGEEGESYKIDKDGIQQTIFPEKIIDKPKVNRKFYFGKFWKKKKELSVYESMVGVTASFQSNSISIKYLEKLISNINSLGFNTPEIYASVENTFAYDLFIKDINLSSIGGGLILSDKNSPEVIFYFNMQNNISEITLNFVYQKDRFSKIVQEIIGIPNLTFASVYNQYDNKWQNETSIKSYEVNNIKTKGLKFTKDSFDKKCIDISYNPGRTIRIKEITIVAGWKMWFGKDFELASLEDIKSANFFISRTEVNGLLEVQLTNEVLYNNEPETRNQQNKFIKLLKK